MSSQNTIKPNDIKFDLISSLRDRLNNPICCAFLVSWTIINWRILTVILGSKKPILERIQYVEQNFFNFNSLYFYPILFASCYLLVMPWLLQGYRWSTRKVTQLNTKQLAELEIKKIEESLPLAEAKKKYELSLSAQHHLEQLEKELAEVTHNFERKKKEHLHQDSVFNSLCKNELLWEDEYELLIYEYNSISKKYVGELDSTSALHDRIEQLEFDIEEIQTGLLNIVKNYDSIDSLTLRAKLFKLAGGEEAKAEELAKMLLDAV